MANIKEEMEIISSCLQDAMELGLEAEVVYSALKVIREDDSIIITQAIKIGYEEWIK